MPSAPGLLVVGISALYAPLLGGTLVPSPDIVLPLAIDATGRASFAFTQPGPLPPGTRLDAGAAVVEVTAEPHTGCQKFAERFGLEAVKFVNSAVGRELNLRGVNARVVQSGAIRRGDILRKRA